MFGLLNVSKPVGPTSHDVVARIRRLLRRGTKVGHAGTLDPFATGVLVICVGPATRLAEYVAGGPKQYVAEVTFGATSTTDDIAGDITETGAAPDEADVRAAAEGFVGQIQQVPPAHSAVHVSGQRAYKLARAGREVELPARPVQIDALELLEMSGRLATFRIDCGTGTYIRALARDLGRQLGCGAYCSALTRTRVGRFTLDQAVAADALTEANLGEHLLPARLAVADWPTLALTVEEERRLRTGLPLPCPADRFGLSAADVAAMDGNGNLVALCTLDRAKELLRPEKVFFTIA